MILPVIAGELVGYLAAMALHADLDTGVTVGGAASTALCIVLLGGRKLLVPTREAMVSTLKDGWWLLLVSLAMCLYDTMDGVLAGSTSVSPDWPLSVLNLAVLCIGVGVFEEGLFRGLMHGGLLAVLGKTRRGIVMATLLASLLFGMAHIAWGELSFDDALSVAQAVLKVVQTGMMGFFFAALVIKNKNLVASIVLHAASDFLLLLTYAGIEGQSAVVEYVSTSQEEALATISFYVLAIALFAPLVVRAVRILRKTPVPDRGAFVK